MATHKPPHHAVPWTDRQGQYLAFIHTYTLLNRRPPAEADIQRFFGVAGPTVHRMLVELEYRGFIRRQPGVARSVEILVLAEAIPPLQEPGVWGRP